MELCLCRAAGCMQVLTNSKRPNQRRRERARRRSGTETELAGQPWFPRTERPTETRRFFRNTRRRAQGDAVNKRAPKSVEKRNWLPERYITRNRKWHGRPESLYATDLKTTSVKSGGENQRARELTILYFDVALGQPSRTSG